MSYWISLQKNGELVSVPKYEEGGTYAIGGTEEADLNVTYNYGTNYARAGFNLYDDLHGKIAADTVLNLSMVVAVLGTVRDSDYWAAADGNAGYAANILLSWARLHPDAIWNVN